MAGVAPNACAKDSPPAIRHSGWRKPQLFSEETLFNYEIVLAAQQPPPPRRDPAVLAATPQVVDQTVVTSDNNLSISRSVNKIAPRICIVIRYIIGFARSPPLISTIFAVHGA